MPHVRSSRRLDTARSAVLVIDLQEKLLPAIPSSAAVIKQTHRVLDAAETLGVPAAATVQYPKGLGNLEPSLADRLPTPESKLDFSAAACRTVLDAWSDQQRDQIVIVGIETHICVLQTVLDLVAEGKQVFVVTEAVAARHSRDHETAIDRIAASGATLTTVESVLFEWCNTADRPEFKAISKLVK